MPITAMLPADGGDPTYTLTGAECAGMKLGLAVDLLAALPHATTIILTPARRDVLDIALRRLAAEIALAAAERQESACAGEGGIPT